MEVVLNPFDELVAERYYPGLTVRKLRDALWAALKEQARLWSTGDNPEQPVQLVRGQQVLSLHYESDYGLIIRKAWGKWEPHEPVHGLTEAVLKEAAQDWVASRVLREISGRPDTYTFTSHGYGRLRSGEGWPGDEFPAPSTAPAPATSAHPLDVTLSFAGEDRASAEAIATRSRARGIKVFYDAYETADLWGKDLYQHLSDVYSNQARFCVVFVSRHYTAKLWTNHELKAAQSRAFREKQEYILPIRLDATELPGLLPTTGYVEWSRFTPDQIVDMIAVKLGGTPAPAETSSLQAAPAPAPRALLKVRPATRVKLTMSAWMMNREAYIAKAAWVADRDGFNLLATLYAHATKSETTYNGGNFGRVSQTAPGRWAYSVNSSQVLGIQHGDYPARSREDAQALLLHEIEGVAPGISQNVQEHDESPGIRWEKFAPTSGNGHNGMRLTFSTHGTAEKVSYRIDFGQPYLSLTTGWGEHKRRGDEIDKIDERDEAAGIFRISFDQPRLTPDKPYVVEVTSDRPWKNPPAVERWEPEP